MRKVVWIVVKSYYEKHRLIRRELYGHSDKVKDCMQMMRDYKGIVLSNQEPFLKDAERITGHYVRSGLDVRSNKGRFIEFRVHSIRIFVP